MTNSVHVLRPALWLAGRAGWLVLAVLVTGATVARAALPEPIAQALREAGVPPSAASLYVREVGREQPLLAHRATTPMNPASTMKIVTTLVGLDVLGPAYTWQTTFASNGRLQGGVLSGALYVKGSGDPKLTSESLQTIVAEAAAGDLVAYTEADRAFHLRILRYTGNDRAVAIIAGLRANTRLYGLARLSESGLLVESAREHNAIVDALEARDPELVAQLMRAHISHTRGQWAAGDRR